MSKDPLALAAVTAGPAHETEYDAVYAAVTATERGRWFLTEFANRNRHADTETVVATLARIEAAVSGGAAPHPAAIEVWRDLNGIATALAQTRAVIAGSKSHAPDPAPDLAGAFERIHDIAFSLRERAVESEFCDALDASLRDIAGAFEAEHGSGNNVRTAAEMLDSLAARIDVLIKRSLTGDAPADDAPTPASESEPLAVVATAIANDDERASQPDPVAIEFETRKRPPPPVADLVNSLADAAFAIGPHSETTLPIMLLDNAAPPEPQPEPHINGGPRWHIESPDFLFQSAAAETTEAAEPAADESAPHALLPQAQLQTEPEDDPDDLFEPAVPDTEPAPPPEPRQANGMPVGTVIYPSPSVTLRTAPSDSFAALRGLSEDELNALFG